MASVTPLRSLVASVAYFYIISTRSIAVGVVTVDCTMREKITLSTRMLDTSLYSTGRLSSRGTLGKEGGEGGRVCELRHTHNVIEHPL